MMIPEYSPRGTSITYRNATAIPPMVYRMSLKPKTTESEDPATEPAVDMTMAVSVYARKRPSSRPNISTSASSSALQASGRMVVAAAPGSEPSRRRARRMKSYSESGLRLERMLPRSGSPAAPSSTGPTRARPHSAGDEYDLVRMVTISGFSKNSQGTWMFKVDVGAHDDSNAYVIRRRFMDFKLLHESLSSFVSAAGGALPELPSHGLLSVFQMFVSPDKMLTARAAKLQELLLVIHAHPSLSKSAAFSNFIGKNPSSLELGYVSLSCYEVPTNDKQLRLSTSSSLNAADTASV